MQNIWKGKAKWYEIMSIYVSYGTSCWIQQESEPPKSTKTYSVPEIKDRQYANHMGGKSQMVRNYVYVSYGISCWIQHLERQNPQKAPKGIVFQR